MADSLKHIKFRFPVYFGDRETQELCWDNESTVETVCLLSNRKPDTTVKKSAWIWTITTVLKMVKSLNKIE